MSEILKAALEYAARGWFVLPLNPGSKVADLLLPEQLGFDWTTETKPDEAMIRHWFDVEPALNIGIRLRGSGLTVVDIDDMDQWLAWPQKALMPRVPCVKTRQGQHHFFVASETDECGAINNDQGYVGDCLTPYPPEWKPKHRAYVVAPPSRHPMGGWYEWIVSPDDGEWTTLPEWIRRSVCRPVPPSSWWETDDEYYDDEYDRIPDCPVCGGEFWDGGTSCTCVDWGEGDDEPYPEGDDE